MAVTTTQIALPYGTILHCHVAGEPGRPVLLPGLLDGLDAWVPQLQLQRLPGASHWLLHEQPDLVQQALTAFLLSK